MAGIKDQKKLTGGKGFKNVKGNFFTYPGEIIKTIASPLTQATNFFRKNKKTSNSLIYNLNSPWIRGVELGPPLIGD